MTFDEQAKKTLLVGVVIAGLIIAGFAYYNFVILGPYYQRNENRLVDLDKEIKVLREQLKEINEARGYADQIAEMRKVVEEYAKRLPNTPDAPGFYQELIRILRITGVRTSRIEPKSHRQETLYTEIPYNIEGRCRYHELGQFINLIEENENRFMRINYLHITNNQDRPSIHPVSVGISTFMFNQ